MGAADEILAPAPWEAELANVVWMAVRIAVLPVREAPARLALAARLGVRSVPVRALWQGALLRSVQSGVATFDGRLIRAFPAIARRPRDLYRLFYRRISREAQAWP
jgi:hypothetical protein